MMTKTCAFVSCDIIGHSGEKCLATQTQRIVAINSIVREVVETANPGTVTWASGGDGGHIAIDIQTDHKVIFEAVRKLRAWSIESGTQLRVCAHVGIIEKIKGADDRSQLVGHGINLAGRLLEYCSQDRIVVSNSFREHYKTHLPVGVEFHSERFVAPKYFDYQPISLLSFDCFAKSVWGRPTDDEEVLLAKSFEEKNFWSVVFHARRLMELNGKSASAMSCLTRLNRQQLTYFDSFSQNIRVNPLLGELDSASLIDFVGATQLVTREAGELLCRQGEEGDTMFIILRGKVGVVFHAHGISENKELEPKVVLEPGAIVGELAFALNRRRSATLSCLEKVHLLAVNPQLYDATIETAASRESLKRVMGRFRLERVLEMVCNSSHILVGQEQKGPFSETPKPWEYLVEHASLIHGSWKLSDSICFGKGPFTSRGVYFLVGGVVESVHESRSTLEESDLPVLFADLDGLGIQGRDEFRAIKDYTLLHVRETAFRNRFISDDKYRLLLRSLASSFDRRTRQTVKEKQHRLKVLYVASNPLSTSSLQLDLEFREIEAKIRISEYRDSVDAVVKLAVTADELQQALLMHKPQLIHFSGHGVTSGEILLENEARDELAVGGSAIAKLLAALGSGVRGAIFNACYSSEIASELVNEVDFAIGMSDALADEAAILFSGAFYRAIGFGLSVQAAFDLGVSAIEMSRYAAYRTVPKLHLRSGINGNSLFLLQ